MFKTNEFLNPTINSRIIEYDIKSGNTSIMEYFHLRPITVINELKSLDKKSRVVEIGKMMREDKIFAKSLEKGFNDIVELFIKENQLDDDHIISIKRDAVFVKDYPIKNTVFGKCVQFIPKNEYVGFIKIKNLEFWIKDDISIDIKGINDDKIPLHKNGILNIISYIYSICIKSWMNKMQINKAFVELTNAYKKKELDFDVYREFNNESMFKIMIMDRVAMMDSITEDLLDRCDITYNYTNIIVPLIRMFC